EHHQDRVATGTTRDDAGPAQVGAHFGDLAPRTAVRADADRRRHLTAEGGEERAGDGVSVERFHQLGPNRSVFTLDGSCPSATRALAAASTKPLGPQMYTRGFSLVGQAISSSSSRSTRPA